MSLETLIPTDEDIVRILTPYHDRLVVQRDELAQETASGLDISIRKDKANTGQILAVGTRCILPICRVMFGRGAGTEVTINGRTIVIMREQDCMVNLDTNELFHDKVLVRPDPRPESIRGIIIPDNVNEQPQAGYIVNFGPKCVESTIGEHVLFGKFAGYPIILNHEDFLVIRERDLVAKL